MAIKNSKLGGANWSTPTARIKPTDLNDTFDATINTTKNLAQVPFSTLKAAGAWTNEGSLAADRFTDSNGVNNTISSPIETLTQESGGGENPFDTSIAFYNNQALFYSNGYIGGFNLEAASDTTHNPNSFTNPDNAFDSTTTTYTNLTVGTGAFDFAFGKTFTEKYVSWFYYGFSCFTGASNSRIVNAYIETYNGSVWTTHTTLFSGTGTRGKAIINYTYIGNNISGIRLRLTGGADDIGLATYIYYLDYGSFSTSSSFICDTNTLSLDGTENSIVVYGNNNDMLYSGTGDGTDDTDAHGFPLDSTQSVTYYAGFSATPKSNLILTTATKSATCSATKAYLYVDGMIVETAAFSGNTATFSNNIVLQAGKQFNIYAGSDGASYTRHYKSGNLTGLLPVLGTNVNWTAATPNQANNIVSITTQNIAGDLTPITNITCDISDGTTTLSAQPLNTVVPINTLGSGTLKLTFNLTTTYTTVTPALYGWGVSKN